MLKYFHSPPPLQIIRNQFLPMKPFFNCPSNSIRGCQITSVPKRPDIAARGIAPDRLAWPLTLHPSSVGAANQLESFYHFINNCSVVVYFNALICARRKLFRRHSQRHSLRAGSLIVVNIFWWASPGPRDALRKMYCTHIHSHSTFGILKQLLFRMCVCYFIWRYIEVHGNTY